MGGFRLRGSRAQQRGRAKRAPGGALQGGHWAGVQGGQAPGYGWRWSPGGPRGQDGSGREGFGGIHGGGGGGGRRGGRLGRAFPTSQNFLQFLGLGPPQVGQGAAPLEGWQEGLQALFPQQQLLHLDLGRVQEGKGWQVEGRQSRSET